MFNCHKDYLFCENHHEEFICELHIVKIYIFYKI